MWHAWWAHAVSHLMPALRQQISNLMPVWLARHAHLSALQACEPFLCMGSIRSPATLCASKTGDTLFTLHTRSQCMATTDEMKPECHSGIGGSGVIHMTGDGGKVCEPAWRMGAGRVGFFDAVKGSIGIMQVGYLDSLTCKAEKASGTVGFCRVAEVGSGRWSLLIPCKGPKRGCAARHSTEVGQVGYLHAVAGLKRGEKQGQGGRARGRGGGGYLFCWRAAMRPSTGLTSQLMLAPRSWASLRV